MPVPDHPTHAKTQQTAGFRYGCHSKPRPVAGQTVTGAECYGSQTWPFNNSTECRADKSLTDPGCKDCPHQGSGEAYAMKVMEESV